MANEVLEHLQIDIEKDSKIVRIKDEFGFVRFIISFIVLEDDNPNGKYLIKVREVTPINEIKDIIREFYGADEYKKANESFKKLVLDYQIFTKSIKPQVDPREIFNDSVNYHKINPKCCKNCIFCVFHDHYNEITGERIVMTLCSCKKNIVEKAYTEEIFHKDGDQFVKNQYIHELNDMIEIEQDCICNNYQKLPQEDIQDEGEIDE